MKRIFGVALFLTGCLFVSAQGDIASMRDNARKFMQSGDMNNAVLVLTKALEADRNNTAVQKDLVLAYFYNKEYTKALELVKPLLERPDADVQSFQLAGNLYKVLEQPKEAERNYKEGLKRFPDSGPLHNEFGELLEQMKNPSAAIAQWEKGMEVAPSYGANYYNAAFHYFNRGDDKVWAIIYGEIYANMESLNPKANIAKKMVLDAYKQKLFASSNLAKDATNIKNDFARAVVETFARQSNISAQGLTPETLAMIRTRFVLDWNNTYAKKFPFRLFDYHQQLMKDGLFDAYNQWMFGPVDNVAAFENWVHTNQEAYDKFTKFHTSRIFKMPKNEVYSAGK